MLFVDAGADHVNIGTSSDLNGVLGVNGLVVSDGVSNGFRVVRGSGAYYGQLYVNYEDSKVNTYIDSIASTSFIGQIIARTSDSSSTATEQFKLSNGVGAIFNETGADLDFRVESDGNTNMLFVDGGNNKVNVGGSTPYGGALNVNGAKNVTAYASDNQIAVTDTTALAAGVGGAINFNGVYTTSGDVTSAAVIEASKINATTAHWGFGLNLRTRTHGANSDSRLYLDQNNTVFNETGADTDFRVESNNNANAIQLDAGNDRLNIDAEVYHDSDSGNQRFYITRSGATDQSGSIYTDDKTFVFDSTQDESTGDAGRFLFRSTNGSASNIGLLILEQNEAIFNEDSNDIDFRVESANNTHAFFVNGAGTCNVGIGRTPVSTVGLDLQGADSGTFMAATIRNSSTNANTAPNTPNTCLLYTSPSPRDGLLSRMPSSA